MRWSPSASPLDPRDVHFVSLKGGTHGTTWLKITKYKNSIRSPQKLIDSWHLGIIHSPGFISILHQHRPHGCLADPSTILPHLFLWTSWGSVGWGGWQARSRRCGCCTNRINALLQKKRKISRLHYCKHVTYSIIIWNVWFSACSYLVSVSSAHDDDDDDVYHAGGADYLPSFLSAFPLPRASSAAASVAPSLGPASCEGVEALLAPAVVLPPRPLICSSPQECHCLSVSPALEALGLALWSVGTCSQLAHLVPR